MKKLILLAVVVFGFTAISFGQHISPAQNIQLPAIAVPAAISPAFAFGATTPMTFGNIVNVKNGGTIHLTPASVISTTNGITVAAGSAAATFIITGATIAPAVTLPTIYFPFTLGKLEILPATDLTVIPDAGIANKYLVEVGGTVTLYDGANGAFTIGGLTISVNNQ